MYFNLKITVSGVVRPFKSERKAQNFEYSHLCQDSDARFDVKVNKLLSEDGTSKFPFHNDVIMTVVCTRNTDLRTPILEHRWRIRVVQQPQLPPAV